VDLVGEVLAPCLRLGERLTSLAVVVLPAGILLGGDLEMVAGVGGRDWVRGECCCFLG
jgi:hypothetical protein